MCEHAHSYVNVAFICVGKKYPANGRFETRVVGQPKAKGGRKPFGSE